MIVEGKEDCYVVDNAAYIHPLFLAPFLKLISLNLGKELFFYLSPFLSLSSFPPPLCRLIMMFKSSSLYNME